jgi:hypothetical protein
MLAMRVWFDRPVQHLEGSRRAGETGFAGCVFTGPGVLDQADPDHEFGPASMAATARMS